MQLFFFSIYTVKMWLSISKHLVGGRRRRKRKCRYVIVKREDKIDEAEESRGTNPPGKNSLPKKAGITSQTSRSPSSLLERKKAVTVKVLPICNTGMPQQNMDSLGSLRLIPVASLEIISQHFLSTYVSLISWTPKFNCNNSDSGFSELG